MTFDYKVIKSNSADGISKLVNKALEDGYTLYGDLKVVAVGRATSGGSNSSPADDEHFYQAVTKKIKSNTLQATVRSRLDSVE